MGHRTKYGLFLSFGWHVRWNSVCIFVCRQTPKENVLTTDYRLPTTVATITKRSDGKYLVRASKGTGSRRVVINRVIRGTLNAARKFARDAETMLDTGRTIRSRVTFAEYFDLWLRAVTPTLSPRTVDGYEGYIRRYALPAIGHLRLEDVEPRHVQAVYIDVGATLSSTTVRNLHAALNACFSWAVSRRYIDRNPCKYTDRPARVRPPIVVLDQAEAAVFAAVCRDMPHGIVFEFALETGMRPEEYLALRWADITGREVSVSRAVQFNRKGGGWYFKDVKTQKGRRRISISDALRLRLAEHRRRQLEHRLALRVTWNDLDLVFPDMIGGPMPITNLSRRYLRPILDRCGFAKHVTLYALRHTCATLLLMNGVNPKVVADRLGHSSVVMTLDTYSHVLPHIQDSATDTIAGILTAKK